MSFSRIRDGARNTRKRGFVEDDLDAVKRFSENFRIVQVAFEEIKVTFYLFEIFAKARDEVVDHSDLRTFCEKAVRKIRADEAGAARDQYSGCDRHVIARRRCIRTPAPEYHRVRRCFADRRS